MIGKLSREIVDAILETLPVEITVLDENDSVVAWNTRRPRIFGRPAEVLGRDIRECHSAKSIDVVERLLGEMKAGKRDSARFWYDEMVDGRSQKIVVDYLAIRDDRGRYLGCVEALQSVEPFRAIEGERRTLDD
ncbi:MAG: PAS domain-containing protein [Candidatus Krumholzibacteriaceae bacterium]|jgi:PAS domain S-box-containing protein